MEDQKSNKIPETAADPAADQRIRSILRLTANPRLLIREGHKFGITTVKTFLKIMLLFVGINALMFCTGTYRLIVSNLSIQSVLFLLAVLLLGIGICMYAAYRTYKFVLFDTLRVLYQNLCPMVKITCSKLVDKAAGIFYRKAEFSNDHIEELVDVDVVLTELYGKVPATVERGIIRLLNKVPFIGMVNELRQEILNGNKEKASEAIFQQMDAYIQQHIFRVNNMRWVYILAAINILLQMLIVFYAI